MSVLLADIDATCASLGYSDGEKYQREPDALQGLKHLIWILRRDLDNHEYRRHLGRAKVLQTDLVYMLVDYIDDEDFADVLIRLLVVLTSPTLLLYREGAPKDGYGRKVFMELVDILQGYKSAFNRDAIWIALCGRMQASLEIDWSLRSEEQNLLVERILVLIRNVLQVPANPEVEGRTDNDASIHDQVIWALHQSGILDLMLFVISSPDEHQFHLHGLEILCLLYREQTAMSLADASLQRSVSEKHRDEQELIAARQREKQRVATRPPPARHTRFGGTYVIRNLKSVSDRDIICHQPLERVMALDFDREKEQRKRSHRYVKEDCQHTRRSAFSVRLCLREYCIEVLRSAAYNTLVRQVRRLLERNTNPSNHDDSYLLWAICFFMEFNRHSGLQLHLVSESLSVQCFHWILLRMQHDMDMITTDKRQARVWSKRLHVALQAFRELLQSLLALQKLKDDKAAALYDMLLNNVCYVLEYREVVLHLLMNYNETHSTKAYLRDVVETASIFMKMMEKFCKDSVVVQDKKRHRKPIKRKSKKPLSKHIEFTEDQLANNWAQMSSEIIELLTTGDSKLNEEEKPLPFDATLEKSIEDQREDCMIRIHKFLRESKLEQAVTLLRAAREVWPENDIFGIVGAAPEDELLLLREIYLHDIATVEVPNDDDDDDDDDSDDNSVDDEENEALEGSSTVEKTFKFEDFAKRLLNPRVVRACIVVLSQWQQIPTKSLKAAVTILHRIAYGCLCPAMLYQASLFRIFQGVFDAPRHEHQEELRRLGIFVVRKFVSTAPDNPKIYAELLFGKSIREANELESGYSADVHESAMKGAWTEDQENELRFLFEENQRNPEGDKDVIDWLLENLIDKARTRRSLLRKLKELGLVFKAPTKRSIAATNAAKNLWHNDEDEELHTLYDQHRMDEDCLERIMQAFGERRNKQQIIKRMLQLYIIADKSEILPKKARGRRSKRNENNDNDHDEDITRTSARSDTMQQRNVNVNVNVKAKMKAKAKKRRTMKTPLDVGTVRSLLKQVDAAKYADAIDWLKNSLEDAAEDVEQTAQEDDAVPLVPLLAAQKDAMDDVHFKKVLVSMGMQPPIIGTENYWRIPTYLNAGDLELRAKILAGDDNLTTDVMVDVEDDNEDDEDEHTSFQNSDDDVGRDNDFSENEDEECHRASGGVVDYMDSRREQMNSLTFSKSDNEDDERPALERKKVTRKRKDRESENDMKRNTKKESSKRSNNKYVDDEVTAKGKTTKKDRERTLKKSPKVSTDELFDQLKAKRSKKLKLKDMVLEKATDDEDDEFNFNSEDYRRRLAELGDSDSDETNGAIVGRQAKIIDYDSYESNEDDDNSVVDGKNVAYDENDADKKDNSDGIVDTISKRPIDGPSTSTANARDKKKRRRSTSDNADDDDDEDNGDYDDNDNDDDDDDNDDDGKKKVNNDVNAGEETAFIKRRKPTTKETIRAGVAAGTVGDGAEQPKRRRIAIIDDDDSDV